MRKIGASILKWIAQKAFSFFVILLILIGFAWIKSIDFHQAEKFPGKEEDMEQGFRKLNDEVNRLKDSKLALREGIISYNTEIAHAEEEIQRCKREIEKIEKEAYWILDGILRPDAYLKKQKLMVKIQTLDGAIGTAIRAREQANHQIALLERNLDAKQRELAELEQRKDVVTAQIQVKKQVGMAFWILLGVIFIPIGIKVFLYFIVAPLAARFPPICLLPDTSGLVRTPKSDAFELVDSISFSAISQEIEIDKHTELLVHQNYLQSTALEAEKKTQWLLNPSIPFSSIASGLFPLVNIKTREKTKVVVSPLKDEMGEIGIIEIPEGAAFVCHPRSLAGLVKACDQQVQISRKWKLGHLQSWITMQLRYLIFHGPCKLIVKGCRGLRMEKGGSGRLINQASTLGFSANLEYSNTRCETFLSYLTGKDDLFDDLFSGEEGFYVYEERPDLKRKSSIVGRGLEGVLDSFLKVFGI